jgi:uncharacterized Zn-binding protein involved in type VI secretion
MGNPAAKQNDQVVAVDTHIVMVPAGPSLVPTPLPHPFAGMLDGALEATVRIDGQPAAVVQSTASNQPPHIPTPPGTSFQRPPADQASVMMASATVLIGGQQAARVGDTCLTCNDPADLPVGQIVGFSRVLIGG